MTTFIKVSNHAVQQFRKRENIEDIELSDQEIEKEIISLVSRASKLKNHPGGVQIWKVNGQYFLVQSLPKEVVVITYYGNKALFNWHQSQRKKELIKSCHIM